MVQDLVLSRVCVVVAVSVSKEVVLKMDKVRETFHSSGMWGGTIEKGGMYDVSAITVLLNVGL